VEREDVLAVEPIALSPVEASRDLIITLAFGIVAPSCWLRRDLDRTLVNFRSIVRPVAHRVLLLLVARVPSPTKVVVPVGVRSIGLVQVLLLFGHLRERVGLCGDTSAARHLVSRLLPLRYHVVYVHDVEVILIPNVSDVLVDRVNHRRGRGRGAGGCSVTWLGLDVVVVGHAFGRNVALGRFALVKNVINVLVLRWVRRR